MTHPGGAHKDEFLACALWLAYEPLVIERREPTEEDLADEQVVVIDVGGRHEPEKGNFDHHQFPVDEVPRCALSLVLAHFGLYEDARRFCEWLEPAEWFDTRGPITTGKWLGVSREAMARLSSPVDVTLLRRFAAGKVWGPGDAVWEVMRMVGEDLVTYVRGLRERLEFIGRHAQRWEVAGQSVLFLPRTEPLPDEPSAGIGRFLEERGWSEEVVALVYPDRRGGGFGLSRYQDHPAFDFTRIEGEADVLFAHARGFVAKTSARDEGRLRELLLIAHTGE